MSILIQIYDLFKTNKHYNKMKTTYLPSSLINSLSSPSQRMILHIVSELDTGRTYEESQRIYLNYFDFNKLKILSKNAFYKAIKELIDRNIIYESNESSSTFYVNYYFINAMNSVQWKQFLNDVRNERTKNYVSSVLNNPLTNISLDEVELVTYEEMFPSLSNNTKDRHRIIK